MRRSLRVRRHLDLLLNSPTHPELCRYRSLLKAFPQAPFLQCNIKPLFDWNRPAALRYVMLGEFSVVKKVEYISGCLSSFCIGPAGAVKVDDGAFWRKIRVGHFQERAGCERSRIRLGLNSSWVASGKRFCLV